MKKIITTVFAVMLAVSSVSLLVGCNENVAEDPDADAKKAGEATMDDENMTDDCGARGGVRVQSEIS